MKLLILTQKVDINDDLLGFFHGWIREFTKYAEKITVIALGVGEYRLPDKVNVLSLGKEQGKSKIKYFFRFYKYIWQERNNYDTVFVHMNKEYILLGGLFWRLTGKKVGFWYQHKKISLWLKLAEIISNIIFTASGESFKLNSKKVKFVGHGIDINKFSAGLRRKNAADNFKITYVGRISLIKNQKLLIEAADILVNKKGFKNIKVDFIGATSYPEDKIYKDEMINSIKDSRLESYINFVGKVPNKDIAQYYRQADLNINLCPTGGMDKAVLESLASGVPAIALNKIFLKIFEGFEPYFILEKADPSELANKILTYKNLNGQEKIRLELLNRVKANYSLDKLIKKIADILQT